MKFDIFLYQTPLYRAVENKNCEMVRLILSYPSVDVNIMSIYDNFLIL